MLSHLQQPEWQEMKVWKHLLVMGYVLMIKKTEQSAAMHVDKEDVYQSCSATRDSLDGDM